MYMNRFVVIDLETTGHAPSKNDKIIEIGMVIIEDNEIIDTETTFFNPDQPIPPFITNLTGISDEDVVDAPVFKEKASTIKSLLEDSYIIAHNVNFDLGFLNAELKENGMDRLHNQVLDTVELSRILFPTAPGYKLSQLSDHFNLQHDDPHRALSDAYVTAKLFQKLIDKINQLPYETIEQWLKLEGAFISDIKEILLKRLDELAFSTDNHPSIQTFQGLAFHMKDVDVKQVHNVQTSFGTYLDTIYEDGGKLSQHLPMYEKRSGQQEMSETIYDAFTSKRHALIEAGTGTGKSLAYLLPAVYYAVKQKQKVIISTHTTQLQSQLLDEEIPLIHAISDIPFQATLLKGKNHYISLEKFSIELYEQGQDNYDVALTKAMLLIWITETGTGDIDEVQLPTSGYIFFRKISADTEKSINPQSPWFQYSYYQQARRKAQRANIIITNHALLCTDMFNDYAFLPSYERVIIDEAHHFEEQAAHHYGLKMDYMSMQFTCNQMGSSEEDKLFGNYVQAYQLSNGDIPLHEWNETLKNAKQEIEDIFQAIYHYVSQQHLSNQALSDVGRIQYRMDMEKETGESWQVILDMSSRLSLYFRDLIHILFMVEERISQEDQSEKNHREELLQMVEWLQRYIDGLELMFFSDGEVEQIKWIEIDKKGQNHSVFLYSEPANVAELLENEFFHEKESVVMTSATLTMNQSFSFMQKRLGLSLHSCITEQIKSPFAYDQQVQMFVPNDFPNIKYGNIDDFVYATAEAIISLAEITSGRMLVLFTSYEMLRKAYYVLKETMETDKYMLIGQGITSGSRARLKKNFQSFDQAILLGTSSFWEGVDIPGDDLSSLVIVRLPFQPPNHPVVEAKSAILKKQQQNPFMELSLPNAVIKFKQGFGRLIRSSSDRGIVFVCDARIVNARYGKYFTESIPKVPMHYDSTQKLIDKAEQWFKKNDAL